MSEVTRLLHIAAWTSILSGSAIIGLWFPNGDLLLMIAGLIATPAIAYHANAIRGDPSD